jgi:hypothetical protein
LQEKEKFLTKCKNALKDAKDAEKAYINSINVANYLRVSFIQMSKNNLYKFHYLEDEFIEYIKNAMRKVSIYTKSSLKNVIHDTEKISNVY